MGFKVRSLLFTSGSVSNFHVYTCMFNNFSIKGNRDVTAVSNCFPCVLPGLFFSMKFRRWAKKENDVAETRVLG